MKPICVPCERFMRPKRNGYYFLEGMPVTNEAPRGKRDPTLWRPYKLWAGDLYECPDCGASTIVGTGAHPIAEHFDPNFNQMVEAFTLGLPSFHVGPMLLVKDC